MAEAEDVDNDKSTRKSRKCKFSPQVLVKDEIRARCKQIRDILKKSEDERTPEEQDVLKQSPEVVKAVNKRNKIQDAQKQRVLEIEDDAEVLKRKCQQLANAIKASNTVVIYTGAGISTAASIPDYRGPNGVWTLLKQGKELTAQDLCDAKPTYTHMGIVKLYEEGHLKHVVSQNCDGLHIRSGLPRSVLSEVHGNMFIEQCKECKPHREYIRLFDVTERTGVRRHETGRKCHKCNGMLHDTIVHFGEKGGLKSPYRWKEAVKAANNSDLILCLGSSLKLLKKYSCLWCMNRRIQKRPKLYIVNLQWTPKDDGATLKINGRCDDVLQQVMSHLGYDVSAYQREKDPIYSLATPLRKKENKSTSKKILEIPPGYVPPTRPQRKPLTNIKEEQDYKPEYFTIKSLLCPDNLPLSSNDMESPSTSVHSPFSSSCDRLDSVKVKTELSLNVTAHPAMQNSEKCIRLLSGHGNMVLPQIIPPPVPVPLPFQSAVLSTNVHGSNDLKMASGMMSKGPSGPASQDIPSNGAPLPGSIILDHCYCKQFNCSGECRNSPEKTLGQQTMEGFSISTGRVQYAGNIQEEAMDLTGLSSRDQPLDLSPRSHKQHIIAATIPMEHGAQGRVVNKTNKSKPPGLIPAASLHDVSELKLETFADLQKFCMMGFPPSLKSSPQRIPPQPPHTAIPHVSVSTHKSHMYVSSSQPLVSVSSPTPPITVSGLRPTFSVSVPIPHTSVSRPISHTTASGPTFVASMSVPQSEKQPVNHTPPDCQTECTAKKPVEECKVPDISMLIKDSVEVNKTSECVDASETTDSASSSASGSEDSDPGTEEENASVQNSGASEKCSQRTKRRSSSASVPGWFGKGLAIKKRRRF